MAQSKLFSTQTGHGDELVLLHGWGLNSAVWTTLLPHLTPYFRVHCLDLPGFGESGWEPGFAQLSAMGERIRQYIEAECAGPVHIVGWSMGGLIATDLALRQPRLVKHLMTVASSPRFVASNNWPGVDESVLNDFQLQLADNLEATLKRFLAVQTLGSPHAREDMKALRQQLLSKPLPHAEALQAGLSWLQHCDLRSQLAELTMPLTRFYGRLDSLVPAKVAEHITAGDMQIFAHSAHAPFMTERVEFAEAIRRRTQ